VPRTATSRRKLIAELRDKEFRDEYVSAHIATGLAHQIRILREQRGWSQRKLAEKVGTKQNVVSRWENPNYGKLTIETVSKLASAFDVALLVRFVSFSRLLTETTDLSPSALRATGFADDVYLAEGSADIKTVTLSSIPARGQLYMYAASDLFFRRREEPVTASKIGTQETANEVVTYGD